jgi:hypothetical protein
MNFDRILEDYLPDDNIEYWNDLIGHVIEVDCKTWNSEYALKKWGADYASRTTKGKIRKVYVPRGKKAPWFEIFFEDCRITYNKLDMEYVLKYSRELPPKYNEIKANYIVELSRIAAEETALRETIINEKQKAAAPEVQENSPGKANEDIAETPALKKRKGATSYKIFTIYLQVATSPNTQTFFLCREAEKSCDGSTCSGTCS